MSSGDKHTKKVLTSVEQDADGGSGDFQSSSILNKSNSHSESDTFYTPKTERTSSALLNATSSTNDYQSFVSNISSENLSFALSDDDTLVDSQLKSLSDDVLPIIDANGNSEELSVPVDNSLTVPSITIEPKIQEGLSEKIAEENGNLDEKSEGIEDARVERGESTDSGEELMDSDLENGSSGYDMDEDDDDENLEARVFTRLERDPNPILPETVTKLETSDGSKVYLVGTAHFSLESQDDVAKTIEATQPDVVMVELCKGRVNILQLDEKTILEEAKSMNLEKVRVAIRQNGFIQGVMYLLLLSMSAHFTKQLGMAPGGEFRRAFSEAKKVPGCLIHLGDRPIQITFQRAIAALSWWQKLRLAWFMITSKEPISKEEVERCKQRDLLEELLAEMTGEFPALSEVFVKERDIYLTHSLQLAANSVRGSYSKSNMAPVPAVVVGIVGMGHVPGIMENWGKISENDIPQLLKNESVREASEMYSEGFGARASLVGMLQDNTVL